MLIHKKPVEYTLRVEHPRGRHKARVLAASTGVTAENAEELRLALLDAAQSQDAKATNRRHAMSAIDGVVAMIVAHPELYPFFYEGVPASVEDAHVVDASRPGDAE